MKQGGARGVLADVWGCDIVVSKFELQSHYCVHFRTKTPGKGKNPPIPAAMS